ncbi:MAG: protein-disulfide reductase DsbD domain-containing protein [Kordiimonas sp.]
MIFSGTANAVEVLRGDLSHSSYEVHFEQDKITPGSQHWLAVRVKPREGWHTYWANPGDSGASPYFSWKTQPLVLIGNPLYGTPERLPLGPLMNYGYHSASTLLFPVSVEQDYQGEALEISAEIEWLVCEIECVPQVDSWSFKVGTTSLGSEGNVFSEARASLPEPSYWDANLTVSNEFSNLLVFSDKADTPNIVDAYFFPHTEGIVSYATNQTWFWSKHGLELKFERSAGMPIPENGKGVLKLIYDDETTQAFEIEANLTLNIRQPDTEPNSAPFSMPIWQAAIFALIGGLILNLMPCVFPVLSLKAFALVSANYRSESNRRKEGWAYTLGIWASFMVIVGVLVTLKAGGSAIGWGFQLQEPLFIGFLILLMVLVALSLAGVFYINTGMEGAGQSLTLR